MIATASTDISPLPPQSSLLLSENFWQPEPDTTPTCDVIFLRNGVEIPAKSVVVLETEIVYQKCPANNDIRFRILRSEILMIKYANGNKDMFPSQQAESSTQVMEGSGEVGLGIGLLSIPIWLLLTILAGFVAGPISIILGISALNSISKNPSKFKPSSEIAGILSIFLGVILLIASVVILLIRIGI